MNKMNVMGNKNKGMGFVEYMRETWLNKLCAIAIMLAGSLPMIHDGDGTALILFAIFAIPLFFSSKNHIVWSKEKESE